MSSITPSSRRSKTSKASKITKKDRDLEMLAAMAPAIQKRTAEGRDIEENSFNVLMTRIVGGFNLAMALLLIVVAAIIASISCCGDTENFDQHRFDQECKTQLERDNGTDAGQWSCYKRNIVIIVVLSFALYLIIVGITIMVGGNLFYGTATAESRSEQELEDIAAELKAQKLHDRIDERAARRERALDRQERRESRALEREYAERQAAQPRFQPGPTNRYAGATPYAGGLQRARSVGAPSTLNFQTYQTGAPVTYTVQRQPQIMYQQPTQYTYGASPQRIQIRTSREHAVPTSPSPVRIRLSGQTGQPAPSSPGRRTVLQF